MSCGSCDYSTMSCVCGVLRPKGPLSPVGLVITVGHVGGVLGPKGPTSLLSHMCLVSPVGLV